MTEPVLAQKLAAALASRQERNIRRRLPDPSLSLSSSTSRTIADSAITAAISPPPPPPPPDSSPVDFSSNDYLSLSTSPLLHARVLAALHSSPSILGSGGSRLLIYNHAHVVLESRLARTFRSPAALLFNSGFNANAGFFACVPQSGDTLLHDEAIHASVHDGACASCISARIMTCARCVLRSMRFGTNMLH
jgi:8-amino-7-oxononanoate synthase